VKQLLALCSVRDISHVKRAAQKKLADVEERIASLKRVPRGDVQLAARTLVMSASISARRPESASGRSGRAGAARAFCSYRKESAYFFSSNINSP
jgi:hypothetical protein